MTCYLLHATFSGSKWCLRGNTLALRKHQQTVHTVHILEGRTPFCILYCMYSTARQHFGTNCINCTVSSKLINKQTNAVSRSKSSQTMLEGVYGRFMTCNIFMAGNSEVSVSAIPRNDRWAYSFGVGQVWWLQYRPLATTIQYQRYGLVCKDNPSFKSCVEEKS